jgi:hypothetical protein
MLDIAPTPYGWPETIIVRDTEQIDDGWQTIFWDEWGAVGICPIEYHIQVGDIMTLYYDHARVNSTSWRGCVIAFKIKNGPLVVNH